MLTTTLLNIKDTNGGELLLTANPLNRRVRVLIRNRNEKLFFDVIKRELQSSKLSKNINSPLTLHLNELFLLIEP